MCIGVPMRVVESMPGRALCESMGEQHWIDTLLVGDQPEGTWLLTFLSSAREVLDEDEAKKIQQALLALDRVREGETDVGHLFADLVDREPQLPEFLQSKMGES